MKIKKFFAAILAVVGICSAAAAIYIGANFTDQNPRLLTPPTEATNKVVALMDAVCAGQYDQVSGVILGTPALGLDRKPADEVGVLIWDAYQNSLKYELVGECYTTEDGLAQDVVLTCLDMESVTAQLRDRSQALLEQRVAEAEDISEVYDENNEYREDFVMEVLYDSAVMALKEDGVEKTVNLTIKLSYRDGSWWVISDSALLDAISGGILF